MEPAVVPEYLFNVILGSSGHLRVTVEPKQAMVEYVRAAVPGITKDEVMNGEVDHRYTITQRPAK